MTTTTRIDAPLKVTGRARYGSDHNLPGMLHGYVVTSTIANGEIVVPRLDWAVNSTYVKVRDRQSYEFALCSAAVALDVRDAHVVDARVAVGGVATVPWRLTAVEAALRGAPVTEDAFQDAAALAADGAEPLSANGFKVPLLRRTVVRALCELTQDEPTGSRG